MLDCDFFRYSYLQQAWSKVTMSSYKPKYHANGLSYLALNF